MLRSKDDVRAAVKSNATLRARERMYDLQMLPSTMPTGSLYEVAVRWLEDMSDAAGVDSGDEGYANLHLMLRTHAVLACLRANLDWESGKKLLGKLFPKDCDDAADTERFQQLSTVLEHANHKDIKKVRQALEKHPEDALHQHIAGWIDAMHATFPTPTLERKAAVARQGAVAMPVAVNPRCAATTADDDAAVVEVEQDEKSAAEVTIDDHKVRPDGTIRYKFVINGVPIWETAGQRPQDANLVTKYDRHQKLKQTALARPRASFDAASCSSATPPVAPDLMADAAFAPLPKQMAKRSNKHYDPHVHPAVNASSEFACPLSQIEQQRVKDGLQLLCTQAEALRHEVEIKERWIAKKRETEAVGPVGLELGANVTPPSRRPVAHHAAPAVFPDDRSPQHPFAC